MHKDYSWSACRASNQIMCSHSSHIYHLLLGFFRSISLCFFGSTLHIFATNHSARASTCQIC